MTNQVTACKTAPGVVEALGNIGIQAAGGTGTMQGAAPTNTSAAAGNCIPLNTPSSATPIVVGTTIGGAAGAAIGSQTTKSSHVGARNGALLGALAGALIGSQCAAQIGVNEQTDGSVKLNIPGKVLFKINSSDLSPDFQSTLDTIGTTIQKYCGLNARVVGHTDT